MRSGFLDFILMPVQFNSIRPPGSRSRLVLKRDVSSLFQTFSCEGGANRCKQEKKADSLSASLFFPALPLRAALDYLNAWNARNKF